MKLLIIEDDPVKLNRIQSLVQADFPKIEIETKISYMGGITAILNKEYDFILLDMSLPRYDDLNNSGNPKNFGGRDILKEMRRHKRQSKVIVVTQYNEFDDGLISIKDLDRQLSEIYPALYLGYIYYETQTNIWERELHDFISNIII